MTFWNTATQEQKLAQIDGGIECGMNATQIAMNCGVSRSAILGLAFRNGRGFAGQTGEAIGRDSRSYISERMSCEATKRQAARTGTMGNAAYSIFDNHSEASELEWPA